MPAHIAAAGISKNFSEEDLIRRLEHALQRRLGDLGKGCADLGLFRRRHPIGLDGRHAGLADAAQERFAKVGIFNGGSGMVMQAAANGFGVRPASEHVGSALPHELAARIGQLRQ